MTNCVDIILKRMETNPEEFIDEGEFGGIHKRWRWLLELIDFNVVSDKRPPTPVLIRSLLLTPEEKQKLRDGFIRVHRQKLEEKVVKQLLGEPDKPDENVAERFSDVFESMEAEIMKRAAMEAWSQEKYKKAMDAIMNAEPTYKYHQYTQSITIPKKILE